MIQRKLGPKLLELAQKYRVVTVIGPRQAGKSTLCKLTFPELPVVNLEDPETRSLAELDPKGLLGRYPEGCFIDEIQRVPELLSYVQVAVDKSQKPGHFILSGSHQLLLLDKVSQSLAGRTAIVKLLPLSSNEIKDYNERCTTDKILIRGAYPEVVSKDLDPAEAYSFYVQTYLERDVREIQAVRDLAMFQRFLTLMAGRSGSLLNMSSLGNEVGVSENTIKNWLSVLEATFVAFRLRPYHRNISKRQVKAPKFYFYDTGILCYLLGICTVEQLQTHPSRGAIFETYVVSELLKMLFNQVRESNLYFFADTVVELDVIIETSQGLAPIEVKSSATFREDLLKQIRKARKRIDLGDEGALVYAGETRLHIQGDQIIPLRSLDEVERLLLS